MGNHDQSEIGKLKLPSHPKKFILDQLALNSILALPVTLDHALHIYELPLIHRDLFDRLLVAQCKLESLSMITIDRQISQYKVETIW